MEHECCPICNSKRLRKLNKYKKCFLVKCNFCSLVFSSEIPTNEEIYNLYNEYEHYGMHCYISPITIQRYDELLLKFSKYKQSKKILDFGCGSGIFLERAKLSGWETYGTELSTVASKKCSEKGIIILDNPETDPKLAGQFDVILFSEVIEHLVYPERQLRILHNYLRPGGLIYITTPNFKSISRHINRSKWSVIGYPEHLCYFTPRTLKRVLRKTGYSIIDLKTHGLSFSRIKAGLKKEKAITIYKNTEDEKLREITENSKFMYLIKSIVNGILSLFKVGDTIKCFAKKPH